MKFTKVKVVIHLPDWYGKVVSAYQVDDIEGLAVHHILDMDYNPGKTWMITHIDSGSSLGIILNTRKQAAKLIIKLAEVTDLTLGWEVFLDRKLREAINRVLIDEKEIE